MYLNALVARNQHDQDMQEHLREEQDLSDYGGAGKYGRHSKGTHPGLRKYENVATVQNTPTPAPETAE